MSVSDPLPELLEAYITAEESRRASARRQLLAALNDAVKAGRTDVHAAFGGAIDETGLIAEWPDLRVIDVTCAEPLEHVTGLRVARPVEGTLLFSWDIPFESVDDGVLFESVDPTGPWARGAEGQPGLTTEERPGLRFFQVAARNWPDCLGPF